MRAPSRDDTALIVAGAFLFGAGLAFGLMWLLEK